MKSAVKIFESLGPEPPVRKIYGRLGFWRDLTRLDSRRKKDMDRWISEALSLLELKGAARRISLRGREKSFVALEEGVPLESAQVADLLKDSGEALLMAATGGQRIMDAIRGDSEQGNLTRGVVLDAVASEMTDACLPWIMDYYRTLLRREGRALTKQRFSAGYGDFGLKNQKTFFDLLELRRLGVTLSESFILTPEKTVTAVAGIV